MAEAKKNTKGPTKGSIEEAASVLKESQTAKEGTGEGTPGEGNSGQPVPGESTGDQKPAEDPKTGDAGAQDAGTASAEGNQIPGTGEQGAAGEKEPAPGEDGSGEKTSFIPQSKAVPVPTASQIEHSAQTLADMPNMLEAFRKTLKRADEIVLERSRPLRKNPEEMTAENHARLVTMYGKDFVTARKGNNRSYFSRKSWNSMGKLKMGWSEISVVMPEVAEAGTTEQ